MALPCAPEHGEMRGQVRALALRRCLPEQLLPPVITGAAIQVWGLIILTPNVKLQVSW